ncbi:MAG TPA: hypothetical protein VLA79_15810 [Polyangia bacterium]|nr:hypothetical protein [Polyangia bacterium]
MNDRGKVHHWSAYVFGEIGSQELDDFGEAIRSPCITSAEVRRLTEAMAERARSYFADGDGDRDNGEWAALGMLDGADAELAGLQSQRAPRARRVGVPRSAGVAEDAMTPTALGA